MRVKQWTSLNTQHIKSARVCRALTEKLNYINIWVKSSVKSALNRKQRKFAVSPRSGIGGLGYAGWSGVIISIGAIIAISCGFEKLWYALGALGLLTIFWLVMSCFFTKLGLICSSRRKSAVTHSVF